MRYWKSLVLNVLLLVNVVKSFAFCIKRQWIPVASGMVTVKTRGNTSCRSGEHIVGFWVWLGCGRSLKNDDCTPGATVELIVYNSRFCLQILPVIGLHFFSTRSSILGEPTSKSFWIWMLKVTPRSHDFAPRNHWNFSSLHGKLRPAEVNEIPPDEVYGKEVSVSEWSLMGFLEILSPLADFDGQFWPNCIEFCSICISTTTWLEPEFGGVILMGLLSCWHCTTFIVGHWCRAHPKPLNPLDWQPTCDHHDHLRRLRWRLRRRRQREWLKDMNSLCLVNLSGWSDCYFWRLWSASQGVNTLLIWFLDEIL